MLNRRTLFARLSAVALAPLAKLLPKPEPEWYPSGWSADPGPLAYNWTAYPHPSLDAGVFYVVNPHLVTYDPSGSVTITVPQEEA